jgi:hypothetical protein
VTTLKELHNEALLNKLHQLVHAERRVTAELLRVLSEVDHRMLYAERGYSSLFAYCVEMLNMSEPSIGVRIHAARCCRRFPRLLDMLHDGRLHLSAILLLAPHAKKENFEQLVEMACNKSKRQLQQALADLDPKPEVPSSIRKLPESQQRAGSASQPSAEPVATCPSASAEPSTSSAPAGCRPAAANDAAPALPLQPTSPVAAPAASATPSAPARMPGVPSASAPEPLGNNRYKIQFTASQQLKDKLEQAGELLQHRINRADMPAILEHALDRLIAEENKRQHGATDKPRQPRQPQRTDCGACATAADDSAASTGNLSKASSDKEPRLASRHIPHHVKREVHARDQGQCTFVSPDGHRCSERGGLQYHHEIPFAKGGESTVGNLRILCRVHNALLARHDYGQDTIEACIARSRQRNEPSGAPVPRPVGSKAASAAPEGVEQAGDGPRSGTQRLFEHFRSPCPPPLGSRLQRRGSDVVGSETSALSGG